MRARFQTRSELHAASPGMTVSLAEQPIPRQLDFDRFDRHLKKKIKPGKTLRKRTTNQKKLELTGHCSFGPHFLQKQSWDVSNITTHFKPRFWYKTMAIVSAAAGGIFSRASTLCAPLSAWNDFRPKMSMASTTLHWIKVVWCCLNQILIYQHLLSLAGWFHCWDEQFVQIILNRRKRFLPVPGFTYTILPLHIFVMSQQL